MINRHYNLAAGLLFVFTWGVGASAYAQTLTAPADQIYVQGEMIIPPFSLPEVTGGTSTYTYSLTPTIPDGLTFDESARTLSGIPTTRGTTTLTYSATDIVTGMVVDDDTFMVTVVPMVTVELLPPSNGDFIVEGGPSTSRHITVKLELADGALELGREVVIPVNLSSMIGMGEATPFLDYSVRVNNVPQTFADEDNPSQMVMVTFAADTTIDPNTMTFLSQIIEIRVKNDMAFEAIESVRFSVGDLLGLKGVTAGAADFQMVTINILSNDGDLGIGAFDMATGGNSVLGTTPPSMFTTTEGDTNTFYVQLFSQPEATVTVMVTSTNTDEGIITSGDSLTFTSMNWSMRQPVIVTGVDDNVVDGNIPYLIDLTPATDDPIYSLPVLTVFIRPINNDNDAVSTINLSVFPTIVDETAGLTTVNVTATLGDGTVVLTTPTDVTVSVGDASDSATKGTDYNASDDFTLTIPALTTIATGQFRIAPITGDTTEGEEMVTISGTATGFTVIPATLILSDVGILVYDTDNFDGNNDISTVTIDEADSAMLWVQLASEPANNVEVTVTSTDTAEGMIASGTMLTFTSMNWNDRQPVTITAVDDNIIRDGDSFTVDFEITTGDGANYTSSLDPNPLTLPDVVVTVIDNDNRAELTIADTSVDEDAGMATLTVTLTPAVTVGDVTVEATTMDGTAEAGTDYTALTSETLTFIAGSTSETLNIPINDDNIDENDETFTVMLRNLMAPTAVTIADATATVTITDDDTAALAFFDAATAGTVVTSITTGEPNATANFYVELTSEPTATVTVRVMSTDASEGTITTGATLTFDDTNWNVRQQVIVTGEDDDLIDGTQTYTVTLNPDSTDSAYNGLADSTITATNTDDDVAAFIVNTDDGVSTSENLTPDSFTVALAAQPTADVTVLITGIDATEHTPTTPTLSTLTFTTTNWSTAQQVTITGEDDDLVDGDQTYDLTLIARNGGYNGVTQTVSVTNEDDDTATLTIANADISVDEDDTTAMLTMNLSAMVTAGDVTVDLTTTDGTAEAGTDYTALTNETVTFTAGSTSQTLDIVISDDNIAENDETFTVMLGNLVVPPAVSGDVTLTDTSATVTITDDDMAALALFDAATAGNPVTTLSTSESGGSADFYAVLTSEPTDDVTVTVMSGDTTEGMITTGGSLTFTDANWFTRQQVTVTAVDDDLVDGDISYDVTLASTSSDAVYNALTDSTVTVTNTDDDSAALALFDAATAGNPVTTLSTSESGGSADFYAVLTSEPTDDVTVTVMSGDTTEGMITTGATLTFTDANWFTRQQVTVTAVDDDLVDGDISYDVTLASTSSDAVYNALTDSTVTVTNTDDDSAALALFDAATAGNPVTTLSTSESGGSADFYVELTSEPTANVTVTVMSGDTSEGMITTGATLTFTDANWFTRQQVTVTAVDDDLVDGDISYDVTLASTSSDAVYNALTDSTVTVTNTDDDSAALALFDAATLGNPVTTLSTSESGGSADFYVELTSEPTANVTVTVMSGDTSEGMITTGATLTFTDANWFTRQQVTVTAVDDDLVDGDISYDVTLASTSSDAVYNALTDSTVTVTNTDDDSAALALFDAATLGNPVTTLSTSESGGSADFYAVLTSEPTDDVTVTVMSGDTTEGMITTGGSLTFTDANWFTRQQVTVTAVDDDLVDGDISYDVTLASTSSDAVYNALTDSTVTVTNTDDDSAALALFDAATAGNPVTTLSTSESGGSADFYAVLTSEPTDDVTVTVMSGDTTEGMITTGATLTFTDANWFTRQQVTVTAVDDDLVDGDISYDVTLASTSSDAVYNALTDSTVTVTNTDDDSAALALFDAATAGNPVTTLSTSESGGSADFYAVLTSEPTDDVTVTVMSGDTTEGMITTGATLTFTDANWFTRQQVTVTAVDDDLVDGDISYDVTLASTSSDAVYNALTDSTVTVTNTDDDSAALALFDAATLGNPVTTLSTSESGGSADFYVELTSEPTDDVTVTVMSGDTTEGMITTGGSLTFTDANWFTRQQVTVTAVDDDLVDGDISYDVTLASTSSDAVYNALTDSTVTVTNTDDDSAALALFDAATAGNPVTTLSTSESGGSADFYAVLTSEPTDDVTVTVMSGDTTEGMITTGATLTFTDANWFTRQQVTVTAVDDDLVDGDISYDVTLASTSSDAVYNALTDSTVTVTNTDDDSAALALFDAATAGNPVTTLSTSESGGSADFYAVLTSEPTDDVTVTVMSGDTTEGMITTGATLTFTDANWFTRQQVTVTAVDDDLVDGDISYDVTLASTSSDAVYNALTDSTVTVTNTDDDSAALALFDAATLGNPVTTLSTSESGGSADFYVELTSEPTANVTVTVMSGDTTEGMITTGATLTFTDANWFTRQQVTVTAVDDDLVDGDISYDVTLASTSSDAVYNALTDSTVTVTNTDDDSAALALFDAATLGNPVTTLSTSESGGSADFYAVLTSEPTDDVTVTVMSGDTTEGMITTGGSLTFTDANWFTRQQVTVTAVDDDLVDGDISYDVTLASTSSDAVYNALTDSTVTVTNTDDDSAALALFDAATLGNPVTTLSTSESGGSADFYVELTSEPTDDVTVTVMSGDTTEGMITTGGSLTFTDANWFTRQQVTVTAVDDDLVDGDISYDVTLASTSSDAVYNALTDSTVTVTNTDDDSAALALFDAATAGNPVTTLSTSESGGSADFYAVLTSEPTDDVTVTVMSGDTTEGMITTGATLTFTDANWFTRQQVTVTAVDDDLVDGDISYDVTLASTSSDAVYNALTDSTVTVTNTDDDSAALALFDAATLGNPVTTLSTSESGGSADFYAVLTSEPTDDVTVTVMSGDTTEGMITTGATLTFTDANWFTRQQVTVTAVDDDLVDGDISYDVTLASTSSDAVYNALTDSTVTVTNTDDDSAALALFDAATLGNPVTTLSTSESGGSADFYVELTSEPTANVTVTVMSGDTTEGMITTGATLTFTDANWFTRQQVTVTAVDDDLVDGDISYDVTLASTSSDAVYNALTDSTVTVTNTDDDSAALALFDAATLGNPVTTLSTSESGGSADFYVELTSEPTDDVTVTVMSGDTTEGMITTGATLTFTDANWFTRQQVTVTAVDDDLVDGDISYDVTLASTSSDAVYNALTDSTVTVTNTDDDSAALALFDAATLGNPVTTLSTSESGGSADFYVELTSEPTDDVTVTVMSGDTTEGMITTGGSLTFTDANWFTRQQVTVTAVDDDLVDGDISYDVTLASTSSDAVYNALTDSTVTVTNTDDDSAALALFDAATAGNPVTTLSTSESGGSADFYAVLTSEPTDDVTVTVMSGDTTEGMITTGATLTFTDANWFTRQQVTVTAVDDDLVDGDISYDVTLASTSSDAVYNALTDSTVTVTNTDDDSAALALFDAATAGNPVTTLSTSESGGSADFYAVLTSEPTDDVTVTVMSGDTTEGMITTGATLTFTDANWFTRQQVTVTAVDDDLVDGDISYDVTLASTSSDAVYNALTDSTVTVTNTDDDSAALALFDAATLGNPVTTLSTSESGGSADFYVELTSEPTANVTVTVMSGDTSEGMITTGATLTFTDANWFTRQQVTVTAVDDDLVDGDISYDVTLASTSSDAVYNALTDSTVTVTNTDDDSAALALFDAATLGNPVTTLSTSESGGSADFYVELTSEPTDDVTVTVMSGDTTEGMITTGATLTFTDANWFTRQQVTVTAVDDDLVDGDISYDVTLASTSSDAVYNALTDSTVTVTNTDDDSAALALFDAATLGNPVTTLSTSESGGSADFYVELTSEPTDDVTVTVMSGDTTEGMITTGGSLTFTDANWFTRQQVTVTAVDDDLVDGDISYDVTLASTSSDAVYNALTDSTVTVTNTDDDSAALALFDAATAGNPVTTLSTSESGGSADFYAVLTSEPTDDVTVTVMSGDTTEGMITTGATLTFTDANWFTRQQVTVTAVDDDLVDGDISYDVTLASTSSDAVYNALTDSTVTVTNTDDDSAALALFDAATAGNPVTTLSTSESGGSADFYAVLTSEPTDDVTVTVMSGDTTEGMITTGATLTFTDANWFTRQQVTVTAVDDDLVDGDISYDVTLASTSSDAVYNALTDSTVTVTNTDDDSAALALFDAATLGNPVTTLSTSESGGSADFYVELTSEPTANVTVTVTSGDTTEGMITTGATLTFTDANWFTRQQVTVTAVDDDLVDGDISYDVTLASTSSDAVYNALTDSTVTVTNTDDDSAALALFDAATLGNPVTTLSTSESGGSADFYVELTSEPTDDVTVTVMSGDTTEGMITTGATLTFTDANWFTRQQVTVTAVDDDLVDGDISYDVTLASTSSDAVYNALTDSTVTVTNTDDDSAALALFDAATLGNPVTTLSTSESGGSADFYVELTSEPTDDVTVTVMSGDTTEGMITTGGSLTFTDANWFTRQQVTVTAVDDDLVDGDISYDVTLASTSSDAVYNALTDSTVTVTNTDDDSAALALFDAATAGNPVTTLSTSESGGSADFYAVLTSEPTDDVTVTVMSGDTTEGMITTGATLTFTDANWFTRQQVTVTAVDDDLVDGDISYDVTLASTSSDAVYNALTDSTVTVTNTDDDSAALALFDAATAGNPVTTLSTSESGGSADFYAVLTSEPTDDVTVTVMSGDTTEGMITTGATLTFTDANWFTRQQVTVTAVDDDLVDGDISYDVTLASTSSDAVYNALTDSTVTVTNTDDDSAALALFDAATLGNPVTTLSTSESGGSADFYVELTSEPTANVTVTVMSGDTTEGMITTGATLTFTDANWFTRQQVTVTAVDDDLVDGDISYDVTLASTSSDAVYNALTDSTVTVTNTDDDSAALALFDAATLGNPVTTLSTSESGGSADFYVELTSEPTANVTVTVMSGDTTEGMITTGGSLTFTDANWFTRQQVTVTAVDDDLVDGDISYDVTLASTSSDAVYNALTDSTVTVTNTDDDSAALALFDAATAGNPVTTLSTSESGGSADFYAVLTSEPTDDVTVTVMSGDTTEGMITTGATLTFTDANWFTRQQVTVTAVDDDLVDGDISYDVTLASTSSDAVYNALTDSTVTVTNTDDDSAALALFDAATAGNPVTTLSTSESGGSADFYAVLTSEPTDDVTVTVMSGDTTEGMITTGATLTFTDANWFTRQQVTVTAVDDDLVDGDISYDVTLASTSSDAVYNALTDSTVTVTNTDDDSAALALFDAATAGNPVTTLSTSESGGSADFYAVLTSEPTDDVTVTVMSGDTTEGMITTGATLTFTDANWFTRQQVTVTAVDDDLVDGDISYDVTLASTSSDAVYNALTDSTVTVTNTDDDSAALALFDAATLGNPVTTLSTSESGGSADFYVELTSEPTANVTVTVMSGDTTEGMITTGATLTFTDANWFTRQQVTVTAVDDDLVDGDISYDVTLASTSSDAVYNALTDSTVTVTNTDDDSAALALFDAATLGNPVTTLSTSESGGSADFYVELTSEPTDDVTVTVMSGDTTEGMITTGATLTFTDANWFTRQQVTVTAVDDDLVDGDISYDVTLASTSSDAVYNALTDSTVTVTNTDDDSAALALFDAATAGNPVTTLSTSESGGSADFYVELTSEPTANVTVTVMSGDTTEGMITTGATLTFTDANWFTRQQVTVTAVDDDLVDGDISYDVTLASTSSDAVYNALTDSTVTVTNTDDDSAALALFDAATLGNPVTTLSTSESGGSADFYVELTSEPTANVTVTVMSGDTSEGMITTGATLTFTDANWFTRQQVTVTAVDDDLVDGDISYDVTLASTSSDAVYNALTDSTVTVTNTDDDSAALALFDAATLGNPVTTLSTSESGGSADFYVELTSEPTDDVTVTVMSGDTTEGMITTGATLTFTDANWFTRQQVTVTAVDDDLVDGDISYDVTLASTSSDAVYNALTDSTVTVTNTDDDSAALALFDAATLGNPVTTLSTSESGGSADFYVELTSEPTANVTVTVMSGDTTEGMITTGATLTFTDANWFTRQQVTVTAVDDDLVDGDISYDVTLASTSSDAVYNALTDSTVTVTNTDDDSAALALFDAATAGNPVTTLSTSESGGSADFYVELTSEPTANVTVTVMSGDTTEGMITTGATLTFTDANWFTRQQVTVTAVDDDLVDGDISYDVTLASTSSDAVYNALTDSTVTVTNTDDDSAALALFDAATLGNPVTTLSTSESGGSADFYAVLTSEPTDDVTVTVMSGDTTEGMITTGGSLTFTDANWFTRQQVTVTAVDDDLVDGDISYDVTLASTSSDAVYNALTDSTVTVTNTDDDSAALALFDAATAGNPVTTLSTSESGGSADFYAVLTSEPTDDVTVTVMSGDTTEGMITTGATLTFTDANWFTRQQVTVTAVDDDLVDGDISYDVTLASTSSDAVYNALTDSTVTVTNTDDDSAALALFDAATAGNPVTTLSTSESGGSADFYVELTSEPTANVTVTVTSGDTSEGMITTGATLTFTDANWFTRQQVTVTAVDDDLVDGDISYDVTLASTSSDAVYNALTDSTVTVTNTDDDSAALALFDAATLGNPVTTLSTSESGGSADFYVELTSEPTANVTVTVTSGDTSEGMITTGATLTFTDANWFTRQQVTVTAVDDDLVDGDISYDVTLASTSSDAVYNALTDSTVTVTNTDDDSAALALFDAATLGNPVTTLSTSESGGSADFYVELTSEPTANVTVTVTSGDTSEGMITTGATLTFTDANWFTRQQVTVTAVDDDLVDGDISYDVTLASTSSDAVYNALTDSTVTVTNTDDDSATTLSIADMRVNENAGIATVTVTLSNGVTVGDVTVDLTTMDGTAEAGEDYTAFTSETLTFAAGSTSETLNIPINNDNVNENDETFTVMLSNLMMPTGVTAVSISNATATVTIIDDDTASTTINLSVSPSTVAETAGATDITVTATLDGAASTMATDVVVTVGGGTATSGTDYTATPTTLTITIPAETISGNGVFSMTPVTDDESDTDETITISGTSGGFTVNSATLTIVEGLNTEQREVLHAELLGVANQATMQVMVDVLSQRLTPRARTTAHGSVAGHALGLGQWQAVDWQKRLSLAVYSTLQRLDEGGALLVPVDATTFNNSEFALPLEVGESVVVLWGALGSSTVEGGQSDASDYDGDLIAVLLGIDSMIGEHARLGIAASYEHSELDYQLDMTSGDAVQTMTGIQPYLSWQPHDSVALWLMGGYGFGDYDATETTAGGTTLRADNADVERWMAALGFHYVHRFGSSGWDMVLHNKALWNRTVRDEARFDDGSLLPKNVSANWRARLESEVGYSWTFGDGSVRPYGLASVRWDGGDVVNDDTTFMVDAGGGVELSFASRLSMDFKVRRQVTDGDHEENNVVAVGSFGFAEHEDGQGWQVALERSLLGGLRAPERHTAGFDFEQGDSTPTIGQSPSLQANVGYGRLINPLNDAEAGLLKTYTRFYLDPDENKRHAVGLGFDFTSLQVGVESEYNNGELETLLWGHIDF